MYIVDEKCEMLRVFLMFEVCESILTLLMVIFTPTIKMMQKGIKHRSS